MPNQRIVPEGAKRHNPAPIEPRPEVRLSSTGVRVHAPGRPNGPSVCVPFILQAWDGRDELDLVPIHRLKPRPEGVVWMSGRGSRFTAEALWSPVHSPVPRWDVAIDLRFVGAQPVDAAMVFAVRLRATSEPGWMIPGLFYGENRSSASRAWYPRFVPPVSDVAGETVASRAADRFASSHWAFRSDRAATPVVFGRDGQGGAALATTASSALGLTGVALAADGDGIELRSWFPYREDPGIYDGSATLRPADLRTYRWQPGETIHLTLRVYVMDHDSHAYATVLRDLHRWLSSVAPLAPWVDRATAANLAAEGLLQWHYRPDHAAFYETAAFERTSDGTAPEPGDRRAMHVGWLSGAPVAAALIAHGRRTGHGEAVRAGTQVLDAIASNLAPCGTFWGQWTADRGWGKGWAAGEDTLHGRTLAEAALFMIRAVVAEERVGRPHGAWRDAIASNLAFVIDRQRPDGAIPSAWNGRTGKIVSWDGSAGIAWVPALVEAAPLVGDAAFVDSACRAGDFYADHVESEFLFGAPEDVDLGPTSEDGYVAVMAYMALAEIETRRLARSRWLELARRAADWMLTFRYSYNVAFAPTTLLGRYDYRSRGADQASPANQHLHGYGLICLPEMVRLSSHTGDPYYLERTRENLACFRQFVAREDGDFNARRGMAPERYYQTNYGGARGSIGPLSHAWCLGLLLAACDAAADLPGLAEPMNDVS